MASYRKRERNMERTKASHGIVPKNGSNNFKRLKDIQSTSKRNDFGQLQCHIKKKNKINQMMRIISKGITSINPQVAKWDGTGIAHLENKMIGGIHLKIWKWHSTCSMMIIST